MVKNAKIWINLISTLVSVITVALGPDIGTIFTRDGPRLADRAKLVVEDNERLKFMQLRYVMLCMAMDHKESDVLISGRPQNVAVSTMS